MNVIKPNTHSPTGGVHREASPTLGGAVASILGGPPEGAGGNSSNSFEYYRSHLFDTFIHSLDNSTLGSPYDNMLREIALLEGGQLIIIDHLMDLADEIYTDARYLQRYLQVCRHVSQIETSSIHAGDLLYQHFSGICIDFPSELIKEERENYVGSRLAGWNITQRTSDFLSKYPCYLPEAAQEYLDHEYDFYAGVSIYLRCLTELIGNPQNNKHLVSRNDLSMMEPLIKDIRDMLDPGGIYIALTQDEFEGHFTGVIH